MLGLMAGQVMLQAAVLCVVLYLVAKHEADYSISKVAMVVAGITLGTFLIDACLTPQLGKFTILVSLVFIAAMLMKFCWVSLKKSVIVVAIYCTFHLMVFFAVAAIKTKIVDSVADTPTIMERQNEDLMAIKDEMERQQRMMAGMAAASEGSDMPQPIPDEDSQPLVITEEAPEDVAPQPLQVIEASEEPAPAVVVVPAPAEPQPAPVKPLPAPAKAATAAATTQQQPPVAPVPAVLPADWRAAAKKLKAGGVMGGSNGKMTAFVNNNLVEVGDVVSAHHEQSLYRWKIKSITRLEGPVFEPLDKKAEK